MKGDGEEEEAGYAGVFVNEANIADAVVVIGKVSNDGVQLCSWNETFVALSFRGC
jgi:hypothetical protein